MTPYDIALLTRLHDALDSCFNTQFGTHGVRHLRDQCSMTPRFGESDYCSPSCVKARAALNAADARLAEIAEAQATWRAV